MWPPLTPRHRRRAGSDLRRAWRQILRQPASRDTDRKIGSGNVGRRRRRGWRLRLGGRLRRRTRAQATLGSEAGPRPARGKPVAANSERGFEERSNASEGWAFGDSGGSGFFSSTCERVTISTAIGFSRDRAKRMHSAKIRTNVRIDRWASADARC